MRNDFILNYLFVRKFWCTFLILKYHENKGNLLVPGNSNFTQNIKKNSKINLIEPGKTLKITVSQVSTENLDKTEKVNNKDSIENKQDEKQTLN